jgi:hypothetical protein
MVGLVNSAAAIDGAPEEVKRGFMRRFSAMIDRSGIARALGVLFGGKRDLYESFGWPRTISSQEVMEMYSRGGVANRIVHAYPDATWGRPPQLYIKGNDSWNKSWDGLVKKTKLWDAIYRADVLAGLGRYSILLIGTKQGNLEAPLSPNRAKEITYLQPYGEETCRVSQWVTDPLDPRFGEPAEYLINYNATSVRRQLSGTSMIIPVRAAFRVHASRVLHISRGGLESKLVGLPRYAPIWNYLLDLMKVIGSSSESYWRAAYQGLHADVDKDLDLDPADEANLSAELDEYQHDMRRLIRTRGTKVAAIGSVVANPQAAFDVLMTVIAGTTGIPKRILLGSEAGQLASAQDRGNWAERVEEHRTLHCEPNILVPLIEWVNKNGILETNLEEVMVLWPEAYRMSPLERAQQGAQIARSLANIAKGLQPISMGPARPKDAAPPTKNADGTTTMDVPSQPAFGGPPNNNAATDTSSTPTTPPSAGPKPPARGAPPPVKDAAPAPPPPQEMQQDFLEPLLTRDEARKILGLSSDDRLLIERPD